MRRLRVGFYVHTWNWAGTARSHERLCLALNQLPEFEVFAIFWPGGDCARLSDNSPLWKHLGKRVVAFDRSQEIGPVTEAYRPRHDNLAELVRDLHLDVLHHARGGYAEWPFDRRIAPIQVETNIFGQVDVLGNVDHSFFVSEEVFKKGAPHGSRGSILPNPIPAPLLSGPSLRGELGIPASAVVCGRTGRPGNFHSWAWEAFTSAQLKHPYLWYLVLGGCQDARAFARNWDLRNVVFLDSTTDDDYLAKFYRSLDIFLHYRSDGETFGCAIAEAMSYGVPVVSHRSGVYDAHDDTVGRGGVVATSQEEMLEALLRYVEDGNRRRADGIEGAIRVAKKYDPAVVVEQYADRLARLAYEIHPYHHRLRERVGLLPMTYR